MAMSSKWSLAFTFFQEDPLFSPITIIIKVLHAVKLSSPLLFPLTAPDTSPQHPHSILWTHTVIMTVVYLYQHHTI